MTSASAHRRRLGHNIGIALANAIFVYLLVSGGAIDAIMDAFSGYHTLASFISGFFFTSLFTTGPSIILLSELGQIGPLWQTVVFGGIGAVVGDLILFRLVRDTFAEDIGYVLSQQKHRRLYHLLHTRFVRHIWPLLGGLIIASPLPDELGITLLGVSRIKTEKFIPISLFFNMLGILLICLAGRLF